MIDYKSESITKSKFYPFRNRNICFGFCQINFLGLSPEARLIVPVVL
jgi:hypothetical protein